MKMKPYQSPLLLYHLKGELKIMIINKANLTTKNLSLSNRKGDFTVINGRNISQFKF